MSEPQKTDNKRKQTSASDWKKFTDTGKKADVLRYLEGTGWEVQKQTFYNHGKAGKLRKNRSGVYIRNDVKRYAEIWLTKADSEVNAGDIEVGLIAAKKQEGRALLEGKRE